MKWNIKDHGESVEKVAAEKLEPSIISRYNAFWGNCIGNVGGKPLQIKGIDSDTNRTRLFLGQCNYTLLQNLLFLDLINEIPKSIKKKESQKLVKSLKLFYQSTHILFNSIELVDHYNQYPLLQTNSKINIDQLHSFKKFRNLLAHGFRPEIKIEQCLHVPKNFELFTDLAIGDHKIWSLDNMGKIEYWSLFEYINFLSEKNKHLLFELLNKSIEFAEKKLKDKNIGQHSTLIKLDSTIFPEISGSTRAV